MADKKITVTITVDNHTHNGKTLKKGEKISVSPDERDFLLKHNIIEA